MNTLNSVRYFVPFLLSALLTACGASDGYHKTAVPVSKPRAELQAEIHLTSPQSNLTYSKLYSEDYGKLLFAIVKDKGVQVIDNSKPESPNGLAFLNLQGIEDVVIEGDTFVTNQYADLVVFSRNKEKEVGRVNDLYDYQSYIELPNNVYWKSNVQIPDDHVVVDYEIEDNGDDKDDDDGFCFLFCW